MGCFSTQRPKNLSKFYREKIDVPRRRIDLKNTHVFVIVRVYIICNVMSYVLSYHIQSNWLYLIQESHLFQCIILLDVFSLSIFGPRP